MIVLISFRAVVAHFPCGSLQMLPYRTLCGPAYDAYSLQALEPEQVRIVVIGLSWVGGRARWQLPAFAPRPWRRLATTYVQERTIGAFALLRRKTPAFAP
jgi:hypothetical protein